ncbi:MAG: caspase family protein [Deltaproteobacteria bacterium]|nr:caspase family protein [Deltaproteobacteria bacterium]
MRAAAAAAITTLIGLVRPSAAQPAEIVAPADRSAALGVVGRRLALVVGTSEHRASAWPTIPNALTDARALADELDRRYGFEVTRLEAPDAATFKREVRRLSEAATATDDLFVFVAGHGHFDEVDNAGYLVFADAEPGCERGCYAFDNLKRSLFDTRARHVLVTLDVCYGGTFDLRVALGAGAPDRSRSDPAILRRLLKEYAQYPSRLVFASVGRATTSDGPTGRHSPFMAALLLALSRPGPSGVVSLDRLFLAAQEGLPAQDVQRPTSFEARVPHHPNGTFLFIEDVDLCEATELITRAAGERFEPIRAEPIQASDWSASWGASWVVPGTSECRVWRWAVDGHAEVRCELGSLEPAVAQRRADELFDRLRGCLAAPTWQPSADERARGARRHHDLVLTRAGEPARRVTVTRACGSACATSLVFE